MNDSYWYQDSDFETSQPFFSVCLTLSPWMKPKTTLGTMRICALNTLSKEWIQYFMIETEIDTVREWIFPSNDWNDWKIGYYQMVKGIKIAKFWLQIPRQSSEYDWWSRGDLMPVRMKETSFCCILKTMHMDNTGKKA